MAPLAFSAAPAGQTDPILAVIAAHRVAWDAAEASLRDGGAGDEAVHTVFSAAFEQLCATRPTTIAGYHALAAHLVWRMRQEGHEVGTGETIVEQAADMLLLGIEALAPLLTSAPALEDPRRLPAPGRGGR